MLHQCGVAERIGFVGEQVEPRIERIGAGNVLGQVVYCPADIAGPRVGDHDDMAGHLRRWQPHAAARDNNLGGTGVVR